MPGRHALPSEQVPVDGHAVPPAQRPIAVAQHGLSPALCALE